MVLLKCIFRVIKYNFKTLSTFHYGSIKIVCGLLDTIDNFSHLHSTMVLLKFFDVRMLYQSGFESTFHYGSIKI